MGSKRKLIYVSEWPYDADGRALPFEDAELARLLKAHVPAELPRAAQQELRGIPRPRVAERPAVRV